MIAGNCWQFHHSNATSPILFERDYRNVVCWHERDNALNIAFKRDPFRFALATPFPQLSINLAGPCYEL
jgi:hypothetical protein